MNRTPSGIEVYMIGYDEIVRVEIDGKPWYLKSEGDGYNCEMGHVIKFMTPEEALRLVAHNPNYVRISTRIEADIADEAAVKAAYVRIN